MQTSRRLKYGSNVFRQLFYVSQCPTAQHIFNLFYIVDVSPTFLLLTEKTLANLFLEYLNVQHRNFKFTVEDDVNNKLPFLDVFITKTNSGFYTSVFRKSYFTRLGTRFFLVSVQ